MRQSKIAGHRADCRPWAVHLLLALDLDALFLNTTAHSLTDQAFALVTSDFVRTSSKLAGRIDVTGALVQKEALKSIHPW